MLTVTFCSTWSNVIQAAPTTLSAATFVGCLSLDASSFLLYRLLLIICNLYVLCG